MVAISPKNKLIHGFNSLFKSEIIFSIQPIVAAVVASDDKPGKNFLELLLH